MRVERLLRSVDFERALGTPPRWRSAHFAVHHVAAGPAARRIQGDGAKLSTSQGTSGVQVVDDSAGAAPLPAAAPPAACWLGVVVPKRHARRSVTRSLLKREIRAGIARHVERLDAGLWVVRLRAPFDAQRYVSAASAALRRAARDELELLFERAAARSRLA
jgi:ribonuclease P protein component